MPTTDPYQAFQDALAANQNGGGVTPGPVAGGGGNTPDLSLSTDQRLNQKVYLGTFPSYNGQYLNKEVGPNGERITRGGGDNITNVADAYDAFHRMSTAEQQKWARLLEQAGIIKPGQYTYTDLNSLWQDAVDQAAEIYRATGGSKKVTPQQLIGMGATLGGSGAGSLGGGPTTNTTNATTSNVTLTTKADARALARQAWQSELGRDPSRKELRAFYAALRSAQKSTPSVSQTTNTVHSTTKGNNTTNTTSSSSVDSGGVDTGAFTANYIDDTHNAELDARRTATDYYSALMQLAGGG